MGSGLEGRREKIAATYFVVAVFELPLARGAQKRHGRGKKSVGRSVVVFGHFFYRIDAPRSIPQRPILLYA
jgi:hypothetical protein